jgi:hypothetical protein
VTVGLAVLSLLLHVLSVEGRAQTISEVTWRGADFVGSVVSSSFGQEFRVLLTVNVDDLLLHGKAELGCSYISKNGEEVDLDARPLGRFSRGKAQFVVPSTAQSVVFTLWERRITGEVLRGLSRDEYQEVMASHDDNEALDRRRRLDVDGYFMYGRLGSTGWVSLDPVREATNITGGTLYP